MPRARTRRVAPVRRRAADAPVVLVALDAADARPLHRQVYDGLREAILAGRLAPGARLPSTRALAADLGVARNTVTLAFEQLRTEGYVVGQRGGGTRVRGVLPDALLHVRRARPSAPAPATAAATPAATSAITSAATSRHADRDDAPVSARGRMLVAAGTRLAERSGLRPAAFRLGMPALEAFPSRTWARLTARRWREDGVFLGDADAAGELPLREAIAGYVTTARGARCTAEQVIVVSGTQQAIDIVARVLLDPGDAAWIEDPGYSGAQAAFAAAGARVVAVPVDDEGLVVAAGERLAPAARMAYVTPSHQFPLGAVMSAARRLALLDWARRARAWIVEDDYDSEFRYTGRPLPCLQGVDEERRPPGEAPRVLYIGTFNKTLVPGLRIGYLVVPPALVGAFRAARAAVDRHPATFAQGALADFIGEGHYARHLRRVRAIYAERQQVLLGAASPALDAVLTLAPDAAGLHLVGSLAPGLDDVAVSRAARDEGVEVFALSRFTIEPAHARRAVLLGYAGFDARAIRAGVRSLARAFARVRDA